MKIMRVILIVTGISLAMGLYPGCSKSRQRAQKPAPIEPTPVSIKTNNPIPDTPGDKTEKAAVIEVEEPVFDIGTVGPNKKVTCTYKFKNIGDANLHIKKILAPCQCTTAELKKKDYAPGEAGSFVVYYRSSSYETRVEKHVHILSNAKNNPRFELTIKGKVEYKVALTPKKQLQLFLNQENAGIPPITIKSKDGKPFSIRSLTSTQNVITADLDTTAEQTEFVIKPKVDIEKLEKSLSGKIDIRLSHPETNLVTLTYSSLPLYVFSPPRFVIQGVKPGQAVERQLWVKSNYQEKVEIESTASTKGYMEVVKQEQHGNSAKLTVRITPPAQEGKTRRYLSDALKITMKDGESGTITMSGWYALKSAK